MLRVAVDLLAEVDPRDLDGREAGQQFARADRLIGRITALTARRLPVVEADGWWAAEGVTIDVVLGVLGRARMTYPRLPRWSGSVARWRASSP